MQKNRSNRDNTCTGVSRRNFLEIGAAALGLGLVDLLKLRATASSPLTSRDRTNKSLIVFWTHGGLSQQDTYDMKPDAPAEFRGPYRPIATTVPGIQLTERFPRQARVMKHLSIVRSINHENAIHAPSAHWMQTGYFGPTLARNAPQKPSFGSVVARVRGVNQGLVPPYLAIPQAEAFGYQGAVYLGSAFNPFEVGANPNATDFRVPNLALPKELQLSSVRSRAKLLREFDDLQHEADRTGVLNGLNGFKAQALEMVTGERVRAAFDISKENPRLRDRYGRHQYGQSAVLARRLIEAGAACVTINTGYWDHHNDIEKGMEEHLPPLDAAIGALVEDLEDRGMLDDVIIYCAGEFGRTPLINGNAGRDHWPNCFSVMLGGGGLKGGMVIGASEPRGGKVRERPVTPGNLLATLYQTLGIPLDTAFEDSSGRPVGIVPEGKPIHELC